jgi:hypothetical protein
MTDHANYITTLAREVRLLASKLEKFPGDVTQSRSAMLRDAITMQSQAVRCANGVREWFDEMAKAS